jgi:prolyl 4-hydroxylase
MVDLNDLIKVYENSLDQEICDALVQIYENTDKHERIDNEGTPNFTQFNLTQNCKMSDEVDQIHKHLISKTFEYRNQYYEFIDKRVFPESHAFEQFRIKKYNPGGSDFFNTHVDVTDYPSARRFLSFFWYLNDVEVGGETRFSSFSISPKKGSLVVFPPLWMFPHKGEPPLSGPKYLLSTYLHYK